MCMSTQGAPFLGAGGQDVHRRPEQREDAPRSGFSSRSALLEDMPVTDSTTQSSTSLSSSTLSSPFASAICRETKRVLFGALSVLVPSAVPSFAFSWLEVVAKPFVLRTVFDSAESLVLCVEALSVLNQSSRFLHTVTHFFVGLRGSNALFFQKYALYFSLLCDNKFVFLKNVLNEARNETLSTAKEIWDIAGTEKSVFYQLRSCTLMDKQNESILQRLVAADALQRLNRVGCTTVARQYRQRLQY